MGFFGRKSCRNKKKKIICVLGTRGFPYVQGGIEKHCEKLYPLIAKDDFDVFVLARKSYLTKKKPFKFKGVKIIPLPNIKSKHLEAFLHTFYGIFVCKKLNCDILHIHAVGPSLFVPLAKLLGMKVVMTHHGHDYNRKKWGKFAKIILKAGEYMGCKFSDEIICVSNSIGEFVEKKYKRKAKVIPNGVVEILDDFDNKIKKQFRIDEKDNILSYFNLEKGKYILSVGRIVPEKGFDCLIKAFVRTKKLLKSREKVYTNILSGKGSSIEFVNEKSGDFNDWKLVIVGNADHKSGYSLKLKKLASNCSDIIFTGILNGEDLENIYKNAGLFVLPSFHEGLPISLLEAMSFGLSCIASSIDGNLDIGLPEKRYFEAGNVESLAEKIVYFINNPIGQNEIRQQKEMIRKKYNWIEIAKRTESIYRMIQN